MRVRLLLAWAAPVLVAATAAPARAQIVNVQGLLSTEAPEGLSGALAGAIDWRTGNVDLLVGSVSPMMRYRSGNHLGIAIVRGELGTSAGTRIIARTFEHLRYRYRFHCRALAETFAQHEYDEFRRLEVRALVGAGPRFDLILRKRLGVGLGVAYLLEVERLADDGEADAGAESVYHRVSSYLTGRWDVGDNLQLIETVYVQPRIDSPGDLRLLDETQLVVKATDKLAFRTSLTIAYDSAPPATIEGLDTTLQSSIGYTF